MTTPNTNTHPAMDACPPLEDIAAFIDGMLSPAERERMTAHLARCESCYEVFAGAVEFQEESSAEDTARRGVLPFPLVEPASPDPTPAAAPLARRKARWFPLAASVVLTAGMGYFAWQALRPPEITVDSVAAAFKRQPEVARFEGSNTRGGEEPGLMFDRSEFMAGVYLLDLRLLGTTEAAKDLLRDLEVELSQIPGWQDPGIDDGQPDLQGLEGEVEDFLEGFISYSFGLWAEGGRLAAAERSDEFFERRNNRRFLTQLQKEEALPVPAELEQLIHEELNKIEALWDKGDLSEQDYRSLATHFQSIINAIDGYEEEDLIYPE